MKFLKYPGYNERNLKKMKIRPRGIYFEFYKVKKVNMLFLVNLLIVCSNWIDVVAVYVNLFIFDNKKSNLEEMKVIDTVSWSNLYVFSISSYL